MILNVVSFTFSCIDMLYMHIVASYKCRTSIYLSIYLSWRLACDDGDEAHLNQMQPRHRRCLNTECASSRETGLFPVHARW